MLPAGAQVAIEIERNNGAGRRTPLLFSSKAPPSLTSDFLAENSGIHS
jgi:hypothetical protein